MIEKVKALKELHREFYEALSTVIEHVKARKMSTAELADLGFLCRESEDLLDDWRKDCKSSKELIGRLIALELITQDQDIVHGKLASATPDLTMRPEWPTRGSVEYEQLLDHFDIPDNDIFRLSWKGVEAHVTKCMENGKPLPPGLQKPKAVYSCTFRRKKNGNFD